MKKIVIILAGGQGSRFGTNIPKQFIEVEGMPILGHTLKRIESYDVDEIIIVCKTEWIEFTKNMISKYNFKKIYSVIPGGVCGHDSIFNGLTEARKIADNNDIVIIHDSVRPLITNLCFLDTVNKAIMHKAACASLKSIEGLVLKTTDEYGEKSGDRNNIVRVQTPQAYNFEMIYNIYKKAEQIHVKYSYADSACILNNIPIYFSKSFVANIKITTKSDIAFFKALMNFSDEELNGTQI